MAICRRSVSTFHQISGNSSPALMPVLTRRQKRGFAGGIIGSPDVIHLAAKSASRPIAHREKTASMIVLPTGSYQLELSNQIVQKEGSSP